MYKKYQRIHFVGIGGVGMSGIAEVLINLGYKVSGSDLKETETTKRLESLRREDIHRTRVRETWTMRTSWSYLQRSRRTTPKWQRRRKRQVPVIPRAEMLAELMRLKYGIAIAGAHGKTTTTSMISTILSKGGIDPTVVIGGKLNIFGAGAKLGQGEFLVAEADESDGSFLMLSPTIAVVTNIDEEHLDHYTGGIEEIKAAFLQFINKIPFYGLAVLCLDVEHIQDLIPQIKKRYVTYGLTTQADTYARDIEFDGMGSDSRSSKGARAWARFELSVPGCTASTTRSPRLPWGLSWTCTAEVIREALAEFGGLHRRFYVKGEVDGITVVDDYGHHPTEIKATLAGAKTGWDRRTVVVFQPHSYTRTRDLMKDFFTAFNQADRLAVMDIYPAGEKPIDGVSAKMLLRRHQKPRP